MDKEAVRTPMGQPAYRLVNGQADDRYPANYTPAAGDWNEVFRGRMHLAKARKMLESGSVFGHRQRGDLPPLYRVAINILLARSVYQASRPGARVRPNMEGEQRAMESEMRSGEVQPAIGGRRRAVFHPATFPLSIGILALLILLAALWPSVASAAECTDTWTGPATGTWSTAGNWSTGKVPTSSDVACIGSGKTVEVTAESKAAVVQGEGTIKIPGGSLELTRSPSEGASSIATLTNSFGTLKGAGEIDVTKTLTLSSGSMSGTGKTVLMAEASGTISGSTWSNRTLVNNGSLTLSSGSLSINGSMRLENNGTFNDNAEGGGVGVGIVKEEGSPLVVNAGTFRKSAGTGQSYVKVSLENTGTISGSSGTLSFPTSAATISLMSGSVAEGSLLFNGAVVTAQNFTSPSGTFEVSGSSLSVEGSYAPKVAHFVLSGGSAVLKGTGTLEVSETLLWGTTAEMRGTGSTVILTGATGTIQNTVYQSQRTLVNSGELTLKTNALTMEEGAKLENKSVFNANSEGTLNGIRKGTGPEAHVVNTGTFQKTSGSGTTEIAPAFLSYGSVHEATGHLTFLNPEKVGRTETFGKHACAGDPVDCATGDFSESQTDLAIGGLGVGLTLTRTYSAQGAVAASSPGAFGYGWSGSFSDHLQSEESGKKLKLTRGDGSTETFASSGGSFTAPSWSFDKLVGSAETGYTLTVPDQTKYAFSGSGSLESVTDRNGNKTTLAYNKSGQLETITDPAGRKITLTYNGGGQVESAKDPLGNVVKYAYEGNKLTSVTMPGEGSPRWQFKYDASRRITSVTDGRGGKTTNEYDSSSRVKSQTDPAERTFTFEYAPFHTKITNKSTGSVTDEWFTSNNEPFSITHGYGTASATTETFSYNAAGQLTGRTDGNGHTTTYGYDSEGNRTSEKDADGNETKWTFDKTHDVLSTTTPRGETLTIERDANGNPEAISRPGPEETTQTTTFEHAANGELESVTDPLERTWTYGYDSYGDRTSEADPLGNTQTLGYDKDSRLTSIVTPRGNLEGAKPAEYETAIERDAQGRPLKATDPLGHLVKYAYDPNGNLESKTDANGYTTKYTYNADNEQTKVEKPSGAVLKTEYDGEGHVTSQTDANNHTTTYVRNILGQPIEVIDPLSRKTLEEFDAAGNLKAVIDPAERKTSYAYDPADRLTEVNYSEEATPDVKVEYDKDGNVTKVIDGTGESTFGYDQLNRLTESEDGHGDHVGYGYNLAEELIGITYPNGKAISRAFDKAGRLESISDWLGSTTSFSYDADSNLEAIAFPILSGNVDEYSFDRADRMSAAKFKSGPETLASLSYLRDKAGQVEEESASGLPGAEELSYGYDKNERLIKAGGASFEYDPADNLTKAPGTTNAYDIASQLESSTGITYTYDKLGERTKVTPGAGPATTYKYDQAGNLIAVERPEEGEVPAINESFAYDGTGLLASKTSGLTTHYFTWDNSGSLPLLLNDGQNSYIYGPNDLPIEQVSTEEEPTYLHHDQLGSTRMLTNAAGEETGAFSYTPFGRLEASTGTVSTPLDFAGQYMDATTGLQYLRARFYDPTTAQFLTEDPLSAVTRSPYGYGAENPLRYVDPSGMSCVNTTNVGPFPVPTSVSPVDCVSEGVGTAASQVGSVAGAAGDAGRFGLDHVSLVVAPFVFAFCVYEPEACTQAAVVGVGVTGAADGTRALIEPCFDLKSALVQDLLVSLAAALPGGIFEATAGRFGPPLTQVARRILQVVLDAPGLAAELVHGASH